MTKPLQKISTAAEGRKELRQTLVQVAANASRHVPAHTASNAELLALLLPLHKRDQLPHNASFEKVLSTLLTAIFLAPPLDIHE